MRTSGQRFDRVRRWLLSGTALAAGAAALASAGAGVTNVYRFGVTRQRRALPGLRRPLRLAFLTDLHLGPFLGLGSLRAWLEAAAATEADLILYGGDLVDHNFRGELQPIAETLAGLSAPLGAYAVLGNHDRSRYPTLEPLTRTFAAAGITLLLNEGRWLREDLYVAGVDDFLSGNPAPETALAAAGNAQGARLLLSHNPDLIPTLAQPTDLVLCGHTHGGQVCPPGLGPIVTSSRYGRRFASGWIEGRRLAFVSRGLGVTLLPLRWRCDPELVVFDFEPVQALAGPKPVCLSAPRNPSGSSRTCE